MKRWLFLKTKVLYILGVFLLILVFQTIFSRVEGFRDFYVSRFYPFISEGLRGATGWFPFSIGDIIYVLVGAWLLIGIYKFVKRLIFIKRHPFAWLKSVLRFMLIVLVAYAVFLIFWGFNYQYDRLYADFGISRTNYSSDALQQLCDTLINKTNALHYQLTGSDTAAANQSMGFIEISRQSLADYQRMARINDVFSYSPSSVKPSMFGYLMNYAGVTGYYNPFTGESQINTTPPTVGLPFTICHEIAHQLGFAAEDDANFISYMVTATSPHLYFRYSANSSILLYAINALSFKAPQLADSLWETRISIGVRKDYEAYAQFYKKFRSGFKPLLDQAYDQYLKANEQERGIRSYRGVIALLLSYKNKYGRLP